MIEEQFKVDPKCWRSDFMMSQESVLYLCKICHTFTRRLHSYVNNRPKAYKVVVWQVQYNSKCKTIRLVPSCFLDRIQQMLIIKFSNVSKSIEF